MAGNRAFYVTSASRIRRFGALHDRGSEVLLGSGPLARSKIETKERTATNRRLRRIALSTHECHPIGRDRDPSVVIAVPAVMRSVSL